MKNVKDLERDVWALSENIKNNLQGITNQAQALTDMRTDIDATEQSIAEITNTLSSIDTSINTLEVGAVNQAEVVSGHTNSITSLQTSVNEHSTAITSLESDVSDNTNSINTVNSTLNTLSGTVNSQASTISGLSTAISNLQSTDTTLTNTTTDHETRITTLESSSGGSSPLPDYYGTTVEALENLDGRCVEEKILNNGDIFELQLGEEYANGPKCTLFCRVNPLGNVNFTGTIKIYLSNIPANTTSFLINIWKNDVQIETNYELTLLTGQEHQAEYSFDFPASSLTKINQIFRIEFNDVALATMVLDKIIITATSGQNFMLLNRDNSMRIRIMFHGTNNSYQTYNKKVSNVYYKRYDENFYTNINYNLVDTDDVKSYMPKIVHDYDYGVCVSSTENPIRLYNSSYCYYIMEDTNHLYYRFNNMNFRDLEKTNVLQVYVDYQYFATLGVTGVCGTTYTGDIFITGPYEKNFEKINLNSNPLPSKFIQCLPIFDSFIAKRNSLFVCGYLLLHINGSIVYIPSRTPNYFIFIDIGTQPYGYVNQECDTIYIYYTKNKKVAKCVLKFNTSTNMWEKAYFGVIDFTTHNIIHRDENRKYKLINNLWLYFTE